MIPIDSGDLRVERQGSHLQQALYLAIRDKIMHGLWSNQGRLPATRKLAEELAVSRNTVTAAYEQLCAEGYIESRRGAGFYVAVELPEHYLASGKPAASLQEVSDEEQPEKINQAFAPGVPDLQQFPLVLWHKQLQRQLVRKNALGNQSIKGCLELRVAIAHYLATSRSVQCTAEQIVITSGAQQALTIATLCVMGCGDRLLMEEPGYTQMRKVATLFGIEIERLPVQVKQGINVQQVCQSTCRAVYLTPSNQYPMGTTLNTEQRLQIIDWVREKQRWIIEDDYDSEFQFAHRPYTSLQGLAAQVGEAQQVIYVGSFSKVMFNGLRLGYVVLPKALVEKACTIKDALTGDSPTHTQLALAQFIAEGDLMRHIRKMRRIYKQKHQQMVESIARHFASELEIISQAAGLHITVRWWQGITEQEWVRRAKENGIIVRPLSYYEHSAYEHSSYEHSAEQQRDWHGAVLGFGNVRIEDIDDKVALLASLFKADSAVT